jgi:DNA repair exonuclease SbcCD nuclease subunit
VKLQLLSDLHLETEVFEATPAPGADVLVLAGDIDTTWAGLRQFAGWPVPVVFVPGNHEFDQRDVDEALADLRGLAKALGIHLLDQDTLTLAGPGGERVRFVGCTRWCDFNVFGEAQRPRTMRAASYFVKVMKATVQGRPFDPEAVRARALAARDWLQHTLAQPAEPEPDATVVVTHFGPSLLSADPRYGRQPGTGSFCNADDDLLPLADLWLHGHLHCRHDYEVSHERGLTRVVSNARGHHHKGEHAGHNPMRLIEVPWRR